MAVLLGEKEENNHIDFGECVMALDTLALAKQATQLKKNNTPIGEIEKQTKKKRAQLHLFFYFIESMPEAFQWYFVNKVVGIKPMVELHKVYGDDLLTALKSLYKQKTEDQKRSSNRITKTEVDLYFKGNESALELPSAPTPTTKQATKKTAQNHVCVNPESGLDCIHQIRQTINANAEFNQDTSDGIKLSATELTFIMQKLDLIEQYFDEQSVEPDEQGDPTDQSVGSYVFSTMVDEPTADYYDQFNLEDLSQDPSDYFQ